MDQRRIRKSFLHRRIFLVFLFSIAFPGLYLSYLGLRSIVKEQDLQRGLLMQSLGRTLEFEIDKFEQQLEKSEESVARSFFTSKTQLSPVAHDTLSVSHPCIEQVFVFDSLFNLYKPLPFASERLGGRAPLPFESFLRNKIEAAEQLETQGDYGAALSSYEQILKEHLSFQTKVVANTYLARTASALGNQALARSAYNAIIEADSTFLLSHPISYAAFAWLEIITDLINRGRTADALQKSMQFHQRLLDFYFQFSSDQHRYFLQKLHAQIGLLEKSSNLTNDLKSILNSLEEREHSLARILSQGEEIELWLQRQKALFYAQNSSARAQHHSLIIDGELTPLSLISIDNTSDSRRWVALVIRPDEIERKFLLPLLQSGDWANDLIVTVRADSLQGVSQQELISSKMHKTAALFPSKRVSVSAKTTTTVKILGFQTSFLSIGFVFLVVGIILLGIFIIYRDIRREEELSRMKSDFISNVSHELKTPIAAIRMLADNLRGSRVAEETRRMEYFRLISKESARLSHLIDNILDFSRMEERRKAFQLEKQSLSEIVIETVRQFKSLMDEKSQTINTDLDEDLPKVLVDPEALAVALLNLLDNAVKYSEKDTQINVRVCRNGASVCIEVEDRGVGISKKDQENIYEKFYRVQRTDGKKIPGSGIGLTLVKEIVDAHKGSVELQSELGVGSTFRIMLPIGG